jgi:hypothetical protein
MNWKRNMGENNAGTRPEYSPVRKKRLGLPSLFLLTCK